MTIGMNLWLVPQISEHCPKKIPGRLIKNVDWFSRPGVASIFTPMEGIVHEWITSVDDTISRICDFSGRAKRLSTSNNRKSDKLFSASGIMYESNSISFRSDNSYDQYH